MNNTEIKNVKLKIDGLDIEVPQGTTILDAAKKANIEIPVLCKHPDIKASGACGICIVEVDGGKKFSRSCCTDVREGMVVRTKSPDILKARKSILELILSNHPTDCLQCGRNTNCELQTLSAYFGLREIHFENINKKLPKDESTKSVTLDPTKCIKCGRCVAVCQNIQGVFALNFVDRGHDTIVKPAGYENLAESTCVKCGQCSAHCPTGAILEYDETEKTWAGILDKDKYPVVQIAPAIRVAIGEAFGFKVGEITTKKLYAVLRKMGFKAVFDTNFGADVTIMEEGSEFIERFVHKTHPLPLITSCCPAWYDYMEKFYPEAKDLFSTAKSPHEIVGVLTKTYFAQKNNIDPAKIFMVSIMPCTAKKYEIQRTEEMFASGHQDIDVSITTRELINMIKQAGINFKDVEEEEADAILGDYTGAGVIFGATGGVMEAALRTAYNLITKEELANVEISAVRGLDGVKEGVIDIKGTKVKVAVTHGLNNVAHVMDKVLAAIKNNEELPYHFIEVMACPGGCISGGGQPYGINDTIRELRTTGIYLDDKKSKSRVSHQNPHVQQLYKEFLDAPLSKKAHELLHIKRCSKC